MTLYPYPVPSTQRPYQHTKKKPRAVYDDLFRDGLALEARLQKRFPKLADSLQETGRIPVPKDFVKGSKDLADRLRMHYRDNWDKAGYRDFALMRFVLDPAQRAELLDGALCMAAEKGDAVKRAKLIAIGLDLKINAPLDAVAAELPAAEHVQFIQNKIAAAKDGLAEDALAADIKMAKAKVMLLDRKQQLRKLARIIDSLPVATGGALLNETPPAAGRGRDKTVSPARVAQGLLRRIAHKTATQSALDNQYDFDVQLGFENLEEILPQIADPAMRARDWQAMAGLHGDAVTKLFYYTQAVTSARQARPGAEKAALFAALRDRAPDETAREKAQAEFVANADTLTLLEDTVKIPMDVPGGHALFKIAQEDIARRRQASLEDRRAFQPYEATLFRMAHGIYPH